MNKIRKKPPISPIVAFCVIWIGVLFLYSLELSSLQRFTTIEITNTVFIIVAPFVFSYSFFSILILTLPRKTKLNFNIAEENNQKLIKSARYSSFVFMLIILLETAIEGYIPLLSMMSGSSISHFDFGISSLHGFCLALGALNTGLLFYIFLKTRSREQIILIFAHLIIFALLVTRKMIVISLIQMFFIYLCMKKINISKKTIPIFLALVVSVFIFGWIGDARTGRDLFLSLANLNFYYPEWMPSGLIWVYIYCVTPILNLTNALYSYTSFSNDLQFICSMVPSVFRSGLACSSSLGFDNEYQISGAFNIATGYIPLYESWGKIGIIIFSFIHGVVASYVTTSFKMNALKIVFYALFMQTTILLIFSNGFLNLNVLAQFFILPVLLWNTRTPQQNPRIFST